MRSATDMAARFLTMPRWGQAVFLAALGAAAALGQAPTGWFWATVAAIAVWLMIAEAARTGRHVFLTTLVFGIGYFAVALRWIVEPFLVDLAQTGWMAPFAIVLMSVGAALFWALAAWGMWRAGLRGRFGFALALCIAEIVRSLILTGFPWALLGHVWIDTPLAQLAAFGGPHLLTLMTVILAWGLTSIRRFGVVPIAVAVAGWFGFAAVPALPFAADAPVVRLIQPNVPQDEKWEPGSIERHFTEIATAVGESGDVDLIVLPETAVATLMEYAAHEINQLSEAAQGVPLITGIQRRDGFRYYNSLLVVARGGIIDGTYDKRHLVPFGEYIPGGEWLRRFGIHGLAASEGGGFTKGTRGGALDVAGIGIVRPLICYEGIFAEEIATGGQRPRAIVLITNDAWFGLGAGPAQHLAQARLRSIEQGLPMVRVANTGISAMIDAYGQVVERLPLSVAGFLDAPLPPARPATIYSHWGDWPLIVALAALIVGRLRIWSRQVT